MYAYFYVWKLTNEYWSTAHPPIKLRIRRSNKWTLKFFLVTCGSRLFLLFLCTMVPTAVEIDKMTVYWLWVTITLPVLVSFNSKVVKLCITMLQYVAREVKFVYNYYLFFNILICFIYCISSTFFLPLISTLVLCVFFMCIEYK
jgi:hypothetical protein